MTEHIIEYGKEPFFSKQAKKEAEKELGHTVKKGFAYVVTVNKKIGPRSFGELKGKRCYSETKKGMSKCVRKFQKEYPDAKVRRGGFD